jgi:hypothetical protein
LALAALGACGGDKTSGDPEVISKGDLNPPANLASITDDEKMMLEWIITNTEEDVVGYNVYVAEGSIEELQGKLSGSLTALDLSSQQIRRCKDTATLFKVFGFDENADQAKKDCDDFGTEDDTPTGASASAGAAAPAPSAGADGVNLADADDSALGSMVKCTDGTTDLGTAGKLSVSIEKGLKSVGVGSTKREDRVGAALRCVIPSGAKLSDGKTGFKNGTKYVAFVVAVKGDDADAISYTSNFVEDVPARYARISFDNLATGKYRPFSIPTASGKVTGAFDDATDAPATADIACPTDSATDFDAANSCRLGRGLAFTSVTAPAFAFVSDAQTGSQRVFVSGQKDKVFLLPARPRNDYAKADGASFAARPGIQEPGDAVLAYANGVGQYQSGVNLEAAPGSLYHVAVRNDDGTYNYGKLYVQTLGTKLPAGTKSVTAWFALQPAVGEVAAESVSLSRLRALLP